ncbi:MAG TPA: hypothetical protein VHX65_16240 [Pirellulales bacterium]|jgi:hypothetical protein|nr:hypothetical protein [Pirellulales bacterium]
MQRTLAICAKLAIFSTASFVGFAASFSANRYSLCQPQALAADDGTAFTDTRPTPSLKDTLDAGLKARLPEEFQFVDRVVRMVDRRQLSLEMVQSTFLWARRKPKFQMQYFEHALRMRAEEVGVRL